jgi:hypothetical protein
MAVSLAFRSSLRKRFWPGREQTSRHDAAADKVRLMQGPKMTYMSSVSGAQLPSCASSSGNLQGSSSRSMKRVL